MAWYRVGTIALTSGSDLVAGTGTAWVQNAVPGGILFTTSGLALEVKKALSDTSLQLAQPYTGATVAGLAYGIAPTQAYVPELTAKLQEFLDGLGDLRQEWLDGNLQAKGLALKGALDDESQLPLAGNAAGDGYMVGPDLFIWTGTAWSNRGKMVTTDELEALRQAAVDAKNDTLDAKEDVLVAKQQAEQAASNALTTVADTVKKAELETPGGVPAYGYSASVVQAILDNAIALDSIVAIRAYADGGQAKAFRLPDGRLYYRNPSGTLGSDDGAIRIVDGDGRLCRLVSYRGELDPFGPLPDGLADNSTAFKGFRDLLKSTTDGVRSSSQFGFRQDRPQRQHTLPGGVLRLTEAQSLGDLYSASTLYGLTVNGVGRGGTMVFFDPPSMYDETGALQANTTTSGLGYREVYLGAAASAANNFYLGWTFTPINGLAADETSVIVAYDGATRKATLSHPLSADPTNGTTYGLAGPLINSFNRLYGLTVRGITFRGGPNCEKRLLFAQYSNGTAQDGLFDECEFTGVWNGLWFFYTPLGASGNNSEQLIRKCAFTGKWRVALQTNGSDQLLNYWFQHCKYWTTSPMIRAIKGSNFHIEYLDISKYGIDNAPASIATIPTWLIDLEGGVNESAQLTFTGTRVECHHPNARILRSKLGGGRIVFKDSHFNKQVGYTTSSDMFQFECGNYGPAVTWNNCLLLGTARFKTASESYRLGPLHAIRDCTHQTLGMPDEFVVTELVSTGNTASSPIVDVTGWKSLLDPTVNNRKYMGDGVVNGHLALIGRQKRFASFKNATSLTPAGSNTVRVPVGSHITSFECRIPAGAADGSNRSWVLQAGVASPITIGTITGVPSAGIAQAVMCNHLADSADAANISLVPQSGTGNYRGTVGFEYIA